MERLIVVWCPSLLSEGERGEEVRQFLGVLQTVERFCPWVDPVRLGVCAIPARGPSRFFGGDAVVVQGLAAALTDLFGTPREACVGSADGLFAGMLAARSQVVVPKGGTAGFLGPWSVSVLRRPELAVTLQRLGIHTLAQFAALPAAHVLARFGTDGAACHRVARAQQGELLGLRDTSLDRRLRLARGDAGGDGGGGDGGGSDGGGSDGGGSDGRGSGGRGSGGGGRGTGGGESGGESGGGGGRGGGGVPRQPDFFGGASAADERADRSFSRVQQRLGFEAVLVGRLHGGRGPGDRARLIPWGSRDTRGEPAGALLERPPAPWPGRLPAPAPVTVPAAPVAAEVVDAAGVPVLVTGRGLLTEPPARLSVDRGPWEGITGWAGPWPVTERWWSARRRRGRLQVVTRSGTAALLVAERARWWLEAVYD